MRRTFALVYGSLLTLTAVTTGVALALIFLVAPEERVMGAVQKIFYVHVPLAFVTFLAVFVLLVGALGYLGTGRPVWDRLARSTCEVGWLFCTLVLVTGPIWAKPAWGIWWTWEAKLTTTLVLWLLLAGILLARLYATTPEQGARVGAVLGVVAALDVPIIYKAVDWWRGQHPIVFGPGKSDPLAPGMRSAFLVAMLAIVLLFGLLVVLRMRLAALEDAIVAAEDAAWRSS